MTNQTTTDDPVKIYKHGTPCMYIEGGFKQEGTFVKWDLGTGNAVILKKDGHEIIRALRDTEGKPVKPDVTKLHLTQTSNFSVEERFEFLENFVDMTIVGDNNATVVAGEGGLGKSYTVSERLGMAGLKEKPINEKGQVGEGDYIVVKGHSTPKAMYRSLFDNKDGIVIYDDCDAVMLNEQAANVLKAALDSYDKRIISWMTELGRGDDDLPPQFEFKGKVIFLTNLPLKRIKQPLISRCMFVDVSMSHKEKIERMRMIAPNINNGVSEEDKNALINFLDELGHKCRDLNMRTFNKSCLVVKQFPQLWRRRVEYLVTMGA